MSAPKYTAPGKKTTRNGDLCFPRKGDDPESKANKAVDKEELRQAGVAHVESLKKLLSAIQKGHKNKVRNMLKDDPLLKDPATLRDFRDGDREMRIMHFAAGSGDREILSIIDDHLVGEDSFDPAPHFNAVANGGETPLTMASRNKDGVDAVRYFLEKVRLRGSALSTACFSVC